RLGVRCAGEGGNYLLVWPPGGCEAAVQALREQHILVRSMAKKPVIDGSFRLTIGTLADMRRFVSAFSTIAALHARSARLCVALAWRERSRSAASSPSRPPQRTLKLPHMSNAEVP